LEQVKTAPDGGPKQVQMEDPRYLEMVNVATALRVAWSLLNDPEYEELRTSVMSLRLMAVMDRALSRLDGVLECWDDSENITPNQGWASKERRPGA
jgi:hypothetical protein